jgi:deoxyribonuclease-4
MHTFAAGFDIRTRDGFLATMEHFDRTVGFTYLRGMHINDSKVALNSHVDRHESLGRGLLGIDVFRCIMADARFENMPLVLETPDETLWEREIQQLMEMC